MIGTTSPAGHEVGATHIDLVRSGDGIGERVVPGEVIHFAGDAHAYRIVDGTDNTAEACTITIAAPGLRQALEAGGSVAVCRAL